MNFHFLSFCWWVDFMFACHRNFPRCFFVLRTNWTLFFYTRLVYCDDNFKCIFFYNKKSLHNLFIAVAVFFSSSLLLTWYGTILLHCIISIFSSIISFWRDDETQTYIQKFPCVTQFFGNNYFPIHCLLAKKLCVFLVVFCYLNLTASITCH